MQMFKCFIYHNCGKFEFTGNVIFKLQAVFWIDTLKWWKGKITDYFDVTGDKGPGITGDGAY